MSSNSFDSIDDNYRGRAQSTPKKTTQWVRRYYRSLWQKKLDGEYNELCRRFERSRKGITDALLDLDSGHEAAELELRFDQLTDEIYKELGDRSVIPFFESFGFEIDIEAEKVDVDIEIADWKSKCNVLLEKLDGIWNEIRKVIRGQKRRRKFLAMKNLIDNID